MPRAHTAYLVLSLAALISPLAQGCGSGGTSERITVQVVSSTPADGATDVNIRATTITAVVDRDLDPATVNTGTVFVNEGGTGGLVGGTVAYDAATRTIAWRLGSGQALNSFLPGEDVLDFDRSYTLTIDGIRSAAQEPQGRTFRATFRTTPLQYAALDAGSDPRPGARDALIDPYFELAGGQLVLTTVKFRVDVPLEPVSVTDPASIVVTTPSGGGTVTVAGDTSFDPATNTIFWVPTAAASANPGFPGEPLLDTATAYTLTVTNKVKTASGNLAPARELEIAFSTGSFAVRLPAALPSGVTTGATITAELILNEVFPNPGTTTANGDANGDGLFNNNENQDEFVEIVNISSAYLDLTGLEIRDGANNLFYAFPSTAGEVHRNLLAPGRAVVVFGGGTPAPSRKAVGRSKVHAGSKAEGSSNATWNNGGGLAPGTFVDEVDLVAGATFFMREEYTAPVPNGASITRSPDVTGLLETDHTAAAVPALNFSPGRKVNTGLFP